MRLKENLLQGEILDDSLSLSLAQLCKLTSLHAELILEMVEYGIVEPLATEPWQFSGAAYRRLRTALRLQGDLGINLAGVALALDLLTELEDLRARIGELKQFVNDSR